MKKTEYQILLNGQRIPLPDDFLPSKNWNNIISKFEARYSGKLTLQKRSILEGNSELFIQGLINPTGYIHLKNKDIIITPWETIAEIESK